MRNTRLHELSDGRIIAITHEPLEGGGWVATHDDVKRLRRIEAKLSHMARHDALTDLPNRVELRERMQQVLAGDALVGHCLVVLLLEIDRFKEVNDTLGPSIGDALLQGVAQRLRRRLDGADMVARVGGDEFVVLQVADEPAAVADALIKRVRAVLGTSFDLDDHTVPITISVGVAIGPADGNEPDELLKNADLALGRAKVDGPGNSRFFEREMDERVRAPPQAGARHAAGAARRPVRALLPAAVKPATSGEISGFRGTAALEPPRARPNPALPSSCRWPRRRASSCRSASGCCARHAQEASGWPKRMRVAVNLSVAQFRSGQVRHSR